MPCSPRSEHTPELLDYVAGTLPAERAHAVQRHLAVCPVCASVVQEQQELWAVLDEWQPAPVSPHFDARLLAHVRAEPAPSWWSVWFTPGAFSWRPVMPVAAACLTVALAALLSVPNLHLPGTGSAENTSVDIEKVQQTLDELDMLRTISPVSVTEGRQKTSL